MSETPAVAPPFQPSMKRLAMKGVLEGVFRHDVCDVANRHRSGRTWGRWRNLELLIGH